MLRRGAVDEDDLAVTLEGRFRFDPSSYAAMVTDTLPGYTELQEQVAAASGHDIRSILDLGMGTGETAMRLLDRHRASSVVGVDESPTMLRAAAERLGSRLEEAHVALLQEPLPDGEFDLVVSALAVHHLDGPEKADLFRRIHGALSPGGRFVLGDLVVPERTDDAVVEQTPGYDKPDTVAGPGALARGGGIRARVGHVEREGPRRDRRRDLRMNHRGAGRGLRLSRQGSLVLCETR